ncbi:hypothetical protein ACJRO7_026948 [Eucalyptus globulus]|uniref:Thionin-like protein n=1 Tax=Eucalyptus globulus TaxID=34317 RepID=A0ABD3JUD7_EUCGL
MVVIASNRMGSTILVVALILWSSIGVNANTDARILMSRKWKCILQCFWITNPFGCYRSCRGRYLGESSTVMPLEHCNVGCVLSTCLGHHLESNKVGVDENKVGACADSCSQSCQKTYSLH